MLLIFTFTHTLRNVATSPLFLGKCPYFESPYSIPSIPNTLISFLCTNLKNQKELAKYFYD